jgi:hypothetical protein
MINHPNRATRREAFDEMLAALKACERSAARSAQQLGETAAQPLLDQIRAALATATKETSK